MTDVSGTASVQGIIQGIDLLAEYFRDYSPDMKSVKYDYRNQNSEMTLKISVPNSLRRKINKVKIPIEEGYIFDEMYSSALNPVEKCWSRTEDFWILDPTQLPSSEDYIIKLIKTDIETDAFNDIIDLEYSEDSVKDEGIEQYWVQTSIINPKILADIYEEFEVRNVYLSINVGVQTCFTTAIPKDVTKTFDRTRELLRASNKGQRGKVTTAHRRRHQAQQSMKMSEHEAAQLIRSLATAENVEKFISIDSPFRCGDVTPTSNDRILPEEVGVDVNTDLDLERKAAAGSVKFNKDEYTEYLEERTDDLR